jgi:hypothetical protein
MVFSTASGVVAVAMGFLSFSCSGLGGQADMPPSTNKVVPVT